MVSFQKSRSAQTGKEGSFLQKRKRELQGNGSGIGEDFSAPLHYPGEVQEQTVQTEVRVQTENQALAEAEVQTAGEAAPENNPEPKLTAEKGGGATESKKDDRKEDEKESGKDDKKDDKKEKKVIRKTIAIEEDVFMQLQLLKVYYRLDHQDVIAIAVKEFLKRHTADGRIKDAELNSVMKMVKELKK